MSQPLISPFSGDTTWTVAPASFSLSRAGLRVPTARIREWRGSPLSCLIFSWFDSGILSPIHQRSGQCRVPRKIPWSAFMAAKKQGSVRRKLIEFDEATWQALDLLARDSMATWQELADEAFRDLLKKHGRPTDLRAALRESAPSREPKNDNKKKR